jgi:hypothetical protein
VAWLCSHHPGFRWLCGGVEVNYHTLADFRVAHLGLLDELLTPSVATLMEQDLVDLNRVAQDGLRVRASAGAASFRRRPTLERCLQEARAQVQRLGDEVTSDPGVASRGQQKARERAAREREERIRGPLAPARDRKDLEQAVMMMPQPAPQRVLPPDLEGVSADHPFFNASFASSFSKQLALSAAS